MSESTHASNERLNEALRQLTDAHLSTAVRYFHVMLLLVATAMSAVLASLLATEPDLPARTIAGFALMLGIAFSWVGYCVWVLLRRKPLLARHRVVAGTMATAFSGLFAGGAWLYALATGAMAAYLSGGLGLLMMAAGFTLLVRAYKWCAELEKRRDDLASTFVDRG